jgi:hypothetical protein
MNGFASRALGFILPLLLGAALYLVSFRTVLLHGFGPAQDLQLQLEQSVRQATERDYDVLVLGNSRMFRGIDPSVLQLPTYNFAFDEDSFLYYRAKARYLLRLGKVPRIALLGVDPFQLGRPNYDRHFIYQRLLQDPAMDARMRDPRRGVPVVYHWVTKRLGFRRLYLSAFYKWLARTVTGQPLPPATVNLRPDGFYEVHEITSGRREDDLSPAVEFLRDPELEGAFRDTVTELRAAGVQVFALRAPSREAETRHYSQRNLEDFHRFLREVQVPFLDFSAEGDFQPSDYSDLFHLVPEAAQRFTRRIDEHLQAQLSSAR